MNPWNSISYSYLHGWRTHWIRLSRKMFLSFFKKKNHKNLKPCIVSTFVWLIFQTAVQAASSGASELLRPNFRLKGSSWSEVRSRLYNQLFSYLFLYIKNVITMYFSYTQVAKRWKAHLTHFRIRDKLIGYFQEVISSEWWVVTTSKHFLRYSRN